MTMTETFVERKYIYKPMPPETELQETTDSCQIGKPQVRCIINVTV